MTAPGAQRMAEPARGRLGLATPRAGLSDWIVCLGWSLFQREGLGMFARALLKCGLQQHRVCAVVNQQLSECARSHLPGVGGAALAPGDQLQAARRGGFPCGQRAKSTV